MSNKIGYYVHHSAEGYAEHGITLDGKYTAPGSIQPEIEKFTMNMEKNSSGLSDAELEEFGDMISAFMTKEEKTGRDNQAIAALEKELWKRFQDVMDKGMYDLSSASIKGVDTSMSIGKVNSAHKTEEKGLLYLDLKNITNKINRLEEIYCTKFSQKSVNTKEFRQLRAEYRRLLEESKKTIAKYDFGPDAKNMLVGTQKEISALRNQLNTLIQKYAAYPNINGLDGFSFETIIPLAAWAADDQANISADDLIKEAVVGENVTITKQYKTDNIGKKVIQEMGEGTFLEANYSQRGKVDVSMQWKGADLKISAKNVTFHDTYAWIDVVSGTPLLSLIQEMDVDFLNHWLNLQAVVGNVNQKSLGEMNNDIKKVIFYRGLTGDAFNRSASDTANLMIINDKGKTGAVKVINMLDLYKKAIEQIDKVSVVVNGKSLTANNTRIGLNNDYSAINWEQRISDLLTQLHQMKVEAKFNAAAIL